MRGLALAILLLAGCYTDECDSVPKYEKVDAKVISIYQDNDQRSIKTETCWMTLVEYTDTKVRIPLYGQLGKPDEIIKVDRQCPLKSAESNK